MSELPEGWAECTLGDVGELHCGQSPASSDVNRAHIGVPYVSGPEQWDGETLHLNKWTTAAKRQAPLRSIFITVKGAGAGTVFPGAACAIGRDIYAFEPHEVVDRGFAQLALSQIVREMRHAVTGLIPGLSKTDILPHRLQLPPLAEQRRIVEKVETLRGRLDRAHIPASRAIPLAEYLRRRILTAAVRGDLTAAWRRRNGVGPWRSARAADVCAKVQSGGTPKAGFVGSGIPFLKVYNIVQQRVEFARSQFVTPDVHTADLRKSIVYPGDVIMNIVGPPLGKVAIVPDSYPEWNMNQALTLFRPSKEVTTEWLYLILCEGRNVADILKDTKGIVGQVNISLSQCRDFEFPIPSVPEQLEIARRANFMLALVEKTHARVTSAVEQLDEVSSAILVKAFAGELVPTEADLARREGRSYESASVLLERIRAERVNAPALPKRRRSAATSASRGAGSPRR